MQQAPQAAETVILRCVVEREEMLPTGKWGNKTEVKGLGLIDVPDYPKAGDKPAEFAYVAFANQNQVEIAEPAFFSVIKGQLWAPPSVYRLQEAAKNAVPVLQPGQVFDPATWQGPIDQLTPQQRRQLYLYQQQIKKEKDRQDAEQRKQKAAAAEAQRKARSGGSGGGGGRRSIGGYDDYSPVSDYAPLPEGVMLAQAGGQPGGQRSSLIEEEMGIRRPGNRGPQPPVRHDDAGRPIGPAVQSNPNLNIQLQGGVPTGPFNPITMANQQAGQPAPAPGQPQPGNNIVCWAHDADVVPGKTYRYRMKVLFKNPLWATNGLCQKPQHEAQFALEVQNVNNNQGWSDWSKEVRVEPTTQYFFASAKQAIQRGAVINAEVDVYKREKGEWAYSRFTVAPGDSIGTPKNGTDFTTGDTLVDLRADVREVRIITADASGELRSSPLSEYQNNPQYKDLSNQYKALQAEIQGQNGTVPVSVPAPGYGTPPPPVYNNGGRVAPNPRPGVTNRGPRD
jgi:hypothetical protein